MPAGSRQRRIQATECWPPADPSSSARRRTPPVGSRPSCEIRTARTRVAALDSGKSEKPGLQPRQFTTPPARPTVTLRARLSPLRCGGMAEDRMRRTVGSSLVASAARRSANGGRVRGSEPTRPGEPDRRCKPLAERLRLASKALPVSVRESSWPTSRPMPARRNRVRR